MPPQSTPTESGKGKAEDQKALYGGSDAVTSQAPRVQEPSNFWARSVIIDQRIYERMAGWERKRSKALDDMHTICVL